MVKTLDTDLRKSAVSEVEFRKRRVKRIKRIIVITVLILLILPTVLCIVMFCKMSQMEKRISELEYALKQETVLSESYVDTDNMQSIPTDKPKEEAESTKAPINTEVPKKTMAPIKTITPVETMAPGSNVNKPSSLPIEGTPTQSAIPTNKPVVIPTLNKSDANNPKRIYLTFDDGPSNNTARILDILKKYNVKATFFVNGKESDLAKQMYKRIVQEGHTLAMHSYTHNYSEIYSSVSAFAKDVDKLADYLESLTGVRPKYYRFPGGSSTSQTKVNIKYFIKHLDSKGIKYFDWNVQNSDAQKVVLTKEELITNVVNGVNRHKDCIVLMHDANSRDNTVESLPKLIELLLDSGAQILPIDDSTPMIVHIDLKE